MEEYPIYIEEDEDEMEGADWSLDVKRAVVEFVLRRFGLLSSADIARALSWKVSEVNKVLSKLEGSGQVKRAKLGRNYVWAPAEERHISPMYY